MKNKFTYIRYFLQTIVLLVVLGNSVFSQGTDSRRKFSKNEKLYFGSYFALLSTNIINEEFDASTPLDNNKGNSLNFGLEFGYFFSKITGISLGAGYDSYSSQITMDSYATKFGAYDSENENYEMQITGSSIIENQKISFLNLPLIINLKIPVGEKFGFYLNGGISFDIPITKTFDGEGTFTYQGFYPAYPILLQNLPDYGFPYNLNTSNSGSLEIKSINTLFCASGGIYCYLSKTMQLVFGFQFKRSMENISDYTPDPEFRLTTQPNELKSIMEGCPTVRLNASGLNIGLRYFFK